MSASEAGPATAGDARAMMLSTDLEGDLLSAYEARIEAAGHRRRQGPARRVDGRRRILLVGYNGAQNTGADLRTGEIILQLRAALGGDRIALGVLAIGDRPFPAWGEVAVERVEGFPPDAVRALCDGYDAVVVCEGSVFTSTFSDALAGMLTAFLGMATAQGKPAAAVGAEADRMTPRVEDFVRRHAAGALLVARSGRSRQRLAEMGLRAVPGTDTGWSYRTRHPEVAETILRGRGWDGEAEVLVLCPTDPFRWPVAADPERALVAALTGEIDPDHHRGMMFFRPAAVAAPRREALLDAVAEAVRSHAAGRPGKVFPMVVGMEPIDAPCCASLAERIGAPAPLVAGPADPDAIVAVLRSASRVVSARYHAVLLAMSVGIPAVGLAFDGRIPALLGEAGHGGLALDMSDPALAVALAAGLDRLACDGDVGPSFTAFASRQRSIQDAMGLRVARHLARGWR